MIAETFPCEECDEHYRSPISAALCADQDRVEAREARRPPRPAHSIIRSID